MLRIAVDHPQAWGGPATIQVMLTITRERVVIVLVTLLLLWSWGPTAPHVAGAVVGIAFFWWFVGPRSGAKVDETSETHA